MLGLPKGLNPKSYLIDIANKIDKKENFAQMLAYDVIKNRWLNPYDVWGFHPEPQISYIFQSKIIKEKKVKTVKNPLLDKMYN